jgi:hypothetical protein
MHLLHDAAGAATDAFFSRWIADHGLVQRFLSDVGTQAAAWADAGELVSLRRLPAGMREELPALSERHRREIRALGRHRAPLEGFRSARMAFWLEAGRIGGRRDAARSSREDTPPFTSVLGHAVGCVAREWRVFGDYEVRSLVDVRHEEFRTGRASRYHYWRAHLGSFAVGWTAASKPQEVFRLHQAFANRIQRRDDGLSNLFAEWLDEERILREAVVELEALPEGEDLSGLITRVVCQELRWRSIEEEIENRALWHASQRRAPELILVGLRLGRIGDYDPEFAGEDRGLVALATLGRLASLSETGHRRLTGSHGGVPTRAIEA